MKQTLKPAPCFGALLVLAAALALAACDNDGNITGPTLPEFPPLDSATNSIWVAGTLATADGQCYEARLLYDGKVIARNFCNPAAACVEKEPGPARHEPTFCRPEGDCSQLELAGSAPEVSGRHAVELQVLRQQPPDAEIVYRAEVELRSDRFGPPQLTLVTNRALYAGDSVVFDVDVPLKPSAP